MRKKNRTFRLLLSFVLGITMVTIGIIPVSVAASSFTDVSDNEYYAEAVNWAVDKGTDRDLPVAV